MRVIIDYQGDFADAILQLRSAETTIKEELQPGEILGVMYENGSHFGIKMNKNSVRVYPQIPRARDFSVEVPE